MLPRQLVANTSGPVVVDVTAAGPGGTRTATVAATARAESDPWGQISDEDTLWAFADRDELVWWELGNNVVDDATCLRGVVDGPVGSRQVLSSRLAAERRG